MNSTTKTSLRPLLVVSARSDAVGDSGAPFQVGLAGPLGRSRVLYALPLGETPTQWIKRPLLVVSSRADGVGESDPMLLGKAGVWVPRMLTARWTEDTRRLAG